MEVDQAVEAPSEHILRQASVTRRALLGKGEMFSSCHLWTPEFTQGAKRWLENFSDAEMPLAAALLDGFLYFSERHAAELMIAGFHALSSHLAPPDVGGREKAAHWTQFFDTVLVASVEGEVPNATDSGGEALRKFRKAVPFPQARTHVPIDALRLLIFNKADNVVFVDDFAGTGQQFIKTWKRQRTFGELGSTSFAQAFQQAPEMRAFYCPSVCTTYALEQIAAQCPQVTVSPGTVLNERYSAVHPDSLIWPPERRSDGIAFVQTLSERLGLPDTNGDEADWRGFNKLGLAVAIRDSIPDGTLRLFRLKQADWAPLMEER